MIFHKLCSQFLIFEVLFSKFDHMELARFLLDCGSYLTSVFDCVSFRNFHLVKEYPIASKFGLRKVVLRAETRFAIKELYKKINGIFCESCQAKSALVPQANFLK